jgi:hypothetical protein
MSRAASQGSTNRKFNRTGAPISPGAPDLSVEDTEPCH